MLLQNGGESLSGICHCSCQRQGTVFAVQCLQITTAALVAKIGL